MHYGKVEGKLIATQKVKELSGYALKVVQPCDRMGQKMGEVVIALDPVGARDGDLVLWVGKREASLAVPDAPLANLYPIDAAITGIIDDIG